MIKSTPKHNVGEQDMTYRMAANAIWNKLNFAMSLIQYPQSESESQLRSIMGEAMALADSIVHDERSGDSGEPVGAAGLPSSKGDWVFESGFRCRKCAIWVPADVEKLLCACDLRRTGSFEGDGK